MEMKLELVPVPVTDVDRAKAFYEKIGFTADMDRTVREGLRFVQFTPPGSACSFAIGEGITGHVVETGRPVLSGDAAKCEFATPIPGTDSIAPSNCVPIKLYEIASSIPMSASTRRILCSRASFA